MLSLLNGPGSPTSVDAAAVLGEGALAHLTNPNVTFCQIVPWQFDYKRNGQSQMNLKRTFRRTSCLLTRLVANLGVAATSPLLDDFRRPVQNPETERRWLHGLYLDAPEEWDDPYRFFPW